MTESKRVINKDNALRKFLVGDSRGFLWEITIDKQQGIGTVYCISGLESCVDEVVEINGSAYDLDPNSNLHRDMQFLTTVIDARFKAA